MWCSLTITTLDSMNYLQLNSHYNELMTKAKQSPSRKDSIHYYHQADKIRMMMCSLPESTIHPCVYNGYRDCLTS